MKNDRCSLRIKRKLLAELKIIENLISRFGGDINLWTAHDNIAVGLDFCRGAGAKRYKRKVSNNFNTEYLSMDMTQRDVRPKMSDTLENFEQPSIKDIILFYVTRRLKSQSGTVTHLYNTMGSLKNYYIALRIWDSIEEIINQGGNYLDVFKSVVFSDSDIANFVFLQHVKYNFGESSIDNHEHLQQLTKIPVQHIEELRNSYDIAIETATCLQLEGVLRDGATADEVFQAASHELPNQWESIDYKIKTKSELIQEIINNHSTRSNDSILPSLKVIGKGRELMAWDLIKEAILSIPVNMAVK
jgi:hypothetical protein